jgi:hypothetical protein
MFSTIQIECIGPVPNPEHLAIDKIFGGVLGISKLYKKRWWVAEITGLCEKYGLSRKFISPRRDSSESNSSGSRGVYANYMLEYGKLYEVSSPKSWKRTDRFFCTGRNPREHITREEAIEWLKNHSE